MAHADLSLGVVRYDFAVLTPYSFERRGLFIFFKYPLNRFSLLLKWKKRVEDD